jgi:C_GCAxxG_C_C family probable redox protein
MAEEINMSLLENKATEYYLADYNCAEALLRAINDVYGLALPEESLKLVSGFGGGMGCQKACGALCSGIAALGPLKVQGRAHITEGFGPLCAGWVDAFIRDLGSDLCSDLKPLYKREGSGCLMAVQKAAVAFERFLAQQGV